MYTQGSHHLHVPWSSFGPLVEIFSTLHVIHMRNPHENGRSKNSSNQVDLSFCMTQTFFFVLWRLVLFLVKPLASCLHIFSLDCTFQSNEVEAIWLLVHFFLLFHLFSFVSFIFFSIICVFLVFVFAVVVYPISCLTSLLPFYLLFQPGDPPLCLFSPSPLLLLWTFQSCPFSIPSLTPFFYYSVWTTDSFFVPQQCINAFAGWKTQTAAHWHVQGIKAEG